MAEPNVALSAQALADLTKGRRSLERYSNDHKQDDLLSAQKYFRSLVSRHPDYPDGYLMLSYTLAENREEREATAVYNQAIHLLGDPPAGELKKRRQVNEAKFLKASSLLRCYRWNEVVAASQEFLALAADLDAQTTNPPQEKAALEIYRQNRYMLARAYAEAAHCFGHLLVLLPKDKSIRPDHEAGLRQLLSAADVDAVPVPDTPAARRTLADRLLAKVEQHLQTARNIDPVYKSEWKGDRAARVAEVLGYARYRHAEWLTPAQNDLFKVACTDAIRNLQEAELRRPRDYALLQNIGMVYLNRRYEADGKDLEVAERYFLRSVALKPQDYYGKEQLARVGLRKALTPTDAAGRDAALAAGLVRIDEALKLRPNGRGTLFIRYYLRVAKVAFAGKQAPAEDLTSLTADITRLDPQEMDLSFRWLRLVCEAHQLLKAADAADLNAKKALLLPRLDAFILAAGEQVAIWRVAGMRTSVQNLRGQLDPLTFPALQAAGFALQFDLASALE